VKILEEYKTPSKKVALVNNEGQKIEIPIEKSGILISEKAKKVITKFIRNYHKKK